jgi:hypothetical protein
MFHRWILLITATVALAIAVVGLGVSHPSDSHILLIATAVAAPESILAALRAIAPEQADDNEPLIGLRAFAEFSCREGFRISLSSMQKYCAPSVNSGPRIIGHWGTLPMSTRGLVRAWIRTRMRPARQTAQPNQEIPAA